VIIMNKNWYKSKKLWTLVGTLGFVILTDTLGVPIDEETYWAVVGIASSYILGQAHVDAKKVEAEKTAPQETIQKF
jgi:uncharacterized membrane protein YuzA (DUF378 family)